MILCARISGRNEKKRSRTKVLGAEPLPTTGEVLDERCTLGKAADAVLVDAITARVAKPEKTANGPGEALLIVVDALVAPEAARLQNNE